MAVTFSSERIEKSILLLRGHKILLDVHLAVLYGVTTKRLNEQVRRNRSRFPADFMFQLSPEEVASLRSQAATSNRGWWEALCALCLYRARRRDVVHGA
jgi:hypothetical protein